MDDSNQPHSPSFPFSPSLRWSFSCQKHAHLELFPSLLHPSSMCYSWTLGLVVCFFSFKNSLFPSSPTHKDMHLLTIIQGITNSIKTCINVFVLHDSR